MGGGLESMGKYPVGERVLGEGAGDPVSSPGSVANSLHDPSKTLPRLGLSLPICNMISKSPSGYDVQTLDVALPWSPKEETASGMSPPSRDTLGDSIRPLAPALITSDQQAGAGMAARTDSAFVHSLIP